MTSTKILDLKINSHGGDTFSCPTLFLWKAVVENLYSGIIFNELGMVLFLLGCRFTLNLPFLHSEILNQMAKIVL